MSIALVDTHCHLDFESFEGDRDAMIERALAAGVTRMVVPGIDTGSSQVATRLAERHEALWVAVGLHPNDLPPQSLPAEDSLDALRSLAQHPKVVAIGEIGLDYHHNRAPAPYQKLMLVRQIELATELNLPVILHNRESTSDMLTILLNWHRKGFPAELKDRPGVLHSFSGNWEEAQSFLAMGFYLGFTGPVTFRNTEDLRLVAANMPLEKMLIETDSPFLAPHPFRGKRNEPAYVRRIAEEIANIRGVTLEALAAQTTENAAHLFGWAYPSIQSSASALGNA